MILSTVQKKNNSIEFARWYQKLVLNKSSTYGQFLRSRSLREKTKTKNDARAVDTGVSHYLPGTPWKLVGAGKVTLKVRQISFYKLNLSHGCNFARRNLRESVRISIDYKTSDRSAPSARLSWKIYWKRYSFHRSSPYPYDFFAQSTAGGFHCEGSDEGCPHSESR